MRLYGKSLLKSIRLPSAFLNGRPRTRPVLCAAAKQTSRRCWPEGTPVPERSYDGVLCIGDPHLSSRVPGFRKDDYPRAILAKLRWAMTLAQRENLLPVLLGDLFHYPRDNANWLIVELLELFHGTVLA